MTRKAILNAATGATIVALSQLCVVTGARAAENQNGGQAAAPASAQATQDASAIGDIIVTARKRAETLQQIPASIAAVDAQGLEKAGVRQLGDISKQVSGLTFVALGGGQPLIAMRGDSNRIGFTDPGVGIYVDGVFVTRFTQLSQTPLDTARVEVLKGPQATLYGKNTVAGAINIITASPTFDWEGYVEGGYGRSSVDENIWHVAGVLSGPIMQDKIAFRIAASHADRDGFLYNPANGSRGLGYRDDSVRAKLLFQPTDALKIELTGSFNDKNAPRGDTLEHHTGTTPLFIRPGLTATIPYSSDPNYWSADVQPYSRSRSWYLTANIGLETGIGTITSLTNYQKSRLNQLTDGDDSFLDIGRQILTDKDTAFSQELRLVGAGGGFTWLGGLYYLDDRDSGFGQTILLGPDSLQKAILGVASQQTLAPSFTKTYAAFGQVGYDLTGRLNILGGLRYAKDDRSFPYSFATVLTNGQTVPGAIVDLQRNKSFQSVTGNAVIRWNFADNARLYASFSTGNKAGGFSAASSAAAALIPYGEQNVKAYEVGLKSELLGRRLRFNIDGFYNDISDLQVQRTVIVGTAATNLTANAASATAYGLDVDIVAKLDRHFQANLSYTYLHARIDRYQFDNNTLLTDVPIARSPKHSGTAGISYSTDAGKGKFDLGANIVFRSNFTNDIFYAPATATLYTAPEPGYSTVNLNGSYSWGRYQIRAYMNNVFNKKYVTQATIVSPAYDYFITPGEPRTFEVSFRISL